MNKLAARNTRLMVLVLIAVTILWMWKPGNVAFSPIDKMPNKSGEGRVDLHDGQMVLHVSGSPEQIGRQHGTLLGKSIRAMLEGYILDNGKWDHRSEGPALLKRVKKMRSALPDWYLRELSACATAAGVNENTLLLAQCEGDIRSLADPSLPAADACSAYVAFDAATSNGDMRAGRNFDYEARDFVHHCALVMYVTPEETDGLPFVAVGWSGILGGWTLVNSEGLIIANHVGGGPKTNPSGIPTLIMTRILAQKSATVEQAVTMLKSLPRMRGQIIWLAQAGDAEEGRSPRAVAVEYDAEDMYVRGARDGVLLVTNQNLLFGSDDGVVREPTDSESRYVKLKEAVKALKVDAPAEAITPSVAGPSTLHCVEIMPEAGKLFVAHGHRPAQSGKFIMHDLPD